MRTEQQNKYIGEDLIGRASTGFDPEDLWLDQDIEPEELIRLDPLDITSQMVEQAEHPELADPVLWNLPD